MYYAYRTLKSLLILTNTYVEREANILSKRERKKNLNFSMEINLMRGEMFDEIRSVLSDLYGADAVLSIASGVKIKEQVSDIFFFKFLLYSLFHALLTIS